MTSNIITSNAVFHTACYRTPKRGARLVFSHTLEHEKKLALRLVLNTHFISRISNNDNKYILYSITHKANDFNHITGTNPEDGFAPWTCIERRFLLGSQYLIEKHKKKHFSNVYRLLRIILNEVGSIKPIIAITTSYVLIPYISVGMSNMTIKFFSTGVGRKVVEKRANIFLTLEEYIEGQ